MSTITTLQANTNGSDSRTIINANFDNLNTDQALKADLVSPTFTGTPILPTGTTGVTQSANDNSTKLATTAYVDAATASASTFVTTQVFSGTAPEDTFTDLNLSSVIGATQRVVLLKVTSNSNGTYTFRRNGDTGQDATVAQQGANTFYSGSGSGGAGYVICTTDTSGVVEWTSSTSTQTVTINLEAYW